MLDQVITFFNTNGLFISGLILGGIASVMIAELWGWLKAKVRNYSSNMSINQAREKISSLQKEIERIEGFKNNPASLTKFIRAEQIKAIRVFTSMMGAGAVLALLPLLGSSSLIALGLYWLGGHYINLLVLQQKVDDADNAIIKINSEISHLRDKFGIVENE